MQLSAATFAQKLTFSKKGASLEQIFAEIEKQTGYNVFYSAKQVTSAKKIDVNYVDLDLKSVLDRLAVDQNLSYTIDEKNISVKMTEPSFLDRLVHRWANIDVKGKVLDENGQPIPGATVQLKDGKKGILTDVNGYFTLKGIDEGAIIIVTIIGYEKKEVIAKPELGNIRLSVTTNPLDEVRVVAYGTTSNRLTVGDSGGIKAEEIEKHPVANVLSALQGQVSGIDIQMKSGTPGSGYKVIIQGINSFNSGSDPLYVVDGVPFISRLSSLGLNAGVVGGTGVGNSSGESPGNPLNFLNPADIASIEVLKDASATAIYGSRAANGAILITTKKGKVGALEIDVNLQNGWSTIPNRVKLLNSEQYVTMRREAFRNSNVAPTATNAYDILGLNSWNPNRTMDWQEILLGGTSQYLSPQINVSGGSQTVQYLLGAGFNRQTTVTPGDFSDRNGSLHFNLSTNSQDQKFKAQLNFNSMVDNNQLQTSNLSQIALTLSPAAPDLYRTDGSINWAQLPSGLSSWPSPSGATNPVAYLEGRHVGKTMNILGNLNLSYSLSNSFRISATSGYSFLKRDEVLTTPLSQIAPANRAFTTRSAQYSNSTLQNFSIEPQIEYSKKFGAGKLNVLLGSSLVQENREALQITGRNHNSDLLLFDLKSSVTQTFNGSENSIYKYGAIFGRLNYNFLDRYIFEGSVRRDGSSRFGPENRFHTFLSIGGAWIISEERIIKKNLPILSFAKLKASYGTTGNDQIGNYSFLDLYSASNGALPYQNTGSFGIDRIYNPYLHWELTKKMNLGMDLGFFKDRFLLSFNYAQNRSGELLFDYSIPATTGFPYVTSNMPAVIQNRNLGINLSAKILENKLKWLLNANWTVSSSKLLSFDNLEESSLASEYVVGMPIASNRVYHFLGMNPANGYFVFADHNGNPTENPNPLLDKNMFLPGQSMDYGGITNTFSYKGFQLSFLLRVGHAYIRTYTTAVNLGGVIGFNQPIEVFQNRWQKPGDQTSVMPFYSSLNLNASLANMAMLQSDFGVVDNWFVRLNNVAFSYQLPEDFLRRIRLKKATLFANAENLAYWSQSKLTGLDPETGFSSIPAYRTITSGIRVTF